jgi:carbon monoxide dehydrogenase subunit G
MQLSHNFTVPASLEETWQAFNDLEQVVPCFPGAALISAEGDAFAGSVKVKLGPISMQYTGTGTWKERDEASGRAVIEARGKDKRGNGTASALVTAQLTADGAGTAVSVETDLNVTGKPAQFGRGVMQDVSDKLLDQFVACLSERLGSSDDAVAPVAATESLETPVRVEPSLVGGAVQAPPMTASPASNGTAAAAAQDPAAAAHEATSRPQGSASADAVQLDLLTTVLPVLAKRYAAPVLGVLVALLVLMRLLRRPH